ncbi:glycosyltransferase family 2 protein [Gillisia sp. M10.2A]|uniref:Glycosyltransferase family 2 protein n=1 Tax=Gillisia lutea TaxID=2909668 RepID=A0ABS9EIQ9_9FLAO|nr:glycosyltransferase family 2 protein [Gillisia lutea]MCF4102232.1 glycosyltransferase family 2 protein [Gillisia lutea]
MKIYIVIPAHNEAENISRTLESLIVQTLLPKKIIVVNDQSTDKTAEIVLKFAEKFNFISLVNSSSSEAHLPGSKVINAFYKGYEQLDEHYDIICKFDADLIFPENYLETLVSHFKNDLKVGMCGGYCSILKDDNWEIEKLTGKDHIRGALKAYRKTCFLQIGKLKPAMGWDTADELLALYHGWRIKVDPTLIVKHLKPTASTYNKASKYKQGEAFYRLRYGLAISLIASAKLAFLKKDLSLFKDYISGYYKAKKEKRPFLVSEEEGRFIRKLRWQKMRSKLL